MSRVLFFSLLSVALACGDDGTSDAELPDASARDAASGDASVRDAATDAASFDASVADAGSSDSGTDAGGSRDAATDGSPGEDAAADAGTPLDATPMDCALATLRFTGGPLPQMTSGSGDDFDTGGGDGCPFPSVTGPDRAYALISELGAGTYRVRVEPVGGVSWDPIVYVRSSCDATDCLAGSNLNGTGEGEQVDVELADGEIVYVIVDTDITSGDPGGGPFTIAAEKLH